MNGKILSLCFILFVFVFFEEFLLTCKVSAYDLPLERKITWQGNVGVKGGVPLRTQEINCVTNYGVHADGNDTSPQIQACINGISNSQVAYLPAGTYTLTSTLNLRSNKTLRGESSETTTLLFTNTALTNDINISGGYTNYPDAPITILSGYTKGSTQLELNNASSFAPGSFVYLTELNDTSIPVSIAGTGGTCTYCGIYGAAGTRARVQISEVVAVNGNTVTISPPLYFTMSAGNSPKANKTPAYIQFAGIENIKVKNGGTTKSSYRRNIHFQGAANCWVKNVKVENCGNRCIDFEFDVFRNEVRDSYVTGCIDRVNSDTCYGVHIDAGSAHLVENNVFETMTASSVVLTSASGNVFAYNYSYSMHRDYDPTGWMWDDHWTHGSHNTFNLWEGNIMQGMAWDIIHGSASHNTLFRNRIYGRDMSVTYIVGVQVIHAISTATNNHYMNEVGNILGVDGFHDTYEIINPGTSWTKKPIWATGGFGGNDNLCFSTTLRHMNYDYVTKSTKKCNDSGEPGCQGGSSDSIMPNSLYLASQPSWWGNLPWPAIGPDLNPMGGDIPAKLRFEGQDAAPPSAPPPSSIKTPSGFQMN